MREEIVKNTPSSPELELSTAETLEDERLNAYRAWASDIFDQVLQGEITQNQGADIIARVRYASDVELEQTRRDSFRDPLTGLLNRGAFDEHIKQLVSEGKPFCLLLIDIDDFKQINDTYGHKPVGDSILVQLGLTLSSKTKQRKGSNDDDLVARWGGEEFAILLTDVPSERELAAIAERHRQAVEKRQFRVDGPGLDGQTTRRIPVTVSIGGAMYRSGNIDNFFVSVDKALYEIKKQPTEDGQIHKNRTIIALPQNVD